MKEKVLGIENKTEYSGTQSAPYIVHAPDDLKFASSRTVKDWVVENRVRFEELLLIHGGILFRGFASINSADSFQDFILGFSGRLIDYTGGASPRSQVHGMIFNSTNISPRIRIELHQEMSYSTNFPDKVAFFCLKPPQTGGETPIVDMRKVYRMLPSDLIARFSRRRLRFIQRFPLKSERLKFRKTWQETFGTNSIDKLRQIVTGQGGIFKRTDNYLEIQSEPTPAIINHPITKEYIWFNQANLHHKSFLRYWAKNYNKIFWLFVLLEPILSRNSFTHYVYDDGTEIEEKDIDAVRQAIDSCEILFSWQKSDILLLENRIMGHGRRPFSGERKIHTALIKVA